MNGEDEVGVSNEHDDVDGTPEDISSTADAGAEQTPSSETDGTAADIATTPAAAGDELVTSDPDPLAADAAADDSADIEADATDGADADADPVDELDEDDASVDADGELVAVGAAAGSARAAARRSAVRSGVTEKKGRATLARDSDREKGANAFQRLGRFLREVVAELRKVIWPHRKQLITYTTVVLVFVVFMTALVFGLDALFARGVLAVFGGG